MKTYFILFVIAGLTMGSLAHAQADRGGSGGDWSEADLKHFLSRLVPYLKSADGQKVFPEVVAYDQAHPDETVEKVASELNPRLVNKPVYDSAANERDCVSYVTPVRYFECNLNSLPRKPSEGSSNDQKSEYYGSMYRLVLHEVFVQVGIEKPLAKEVPSAYEYSSRLMVHLEAFPEWVPGSSKFGEYNKSDIHIHSHPEFSIGIDGGRLLQTTALGLNLQLQFPATIGPVDFKFGIETGFEYGIRVPNLTWAVPIFATFEFQFPEIVKLHPYLKAGVGVIITHQTRTYGDNFTDYDANGLPIQTEQYVYAYGETATNLSVLITPGFDFGSHDQFFLEIPIRTMGSPQGLSIMPTLGMHF